VGPLKDLKALAAILKHLRHERKFFETTVLIQRAEDLVLASDLHPIAGAQIHLRILTYECL
jgi:hypothetical protein